MTQMTFFVPNPNQATTEGPWQKKVSYAILSIVYIIVTMTAKVGYVCHHRSGNTPSSCISRVEKKKACVVVWVGVCLVQTQMYGKLHQRTSHLIC